MDAFSKKLLCLVLVGGAFLCSCGKEIPIFDGERAFAYIIAQTGFGPRNPGSQGHDDCLDYLLKEFSQYAMPGNVKRQPFAFTDTSTGSSYTLTNIIVSFNLSPENDRRIMLSAHWDTRPHADNDPDPENHSTPIPGANDGASGVAVLLEIARILKENPPPVGVDIILFDGEDYGRSEINGLEDYFLGSKYFAETKGDYRPEFGVLLDMVGSSEAQFYIEGFSNQYAPALVHRIWDKAEELKLDRFVHDYGPSINDDHVILNQAGIPTVDIIDINRSAINYKYWHTLADTPDKCSPETLTQVGTILLYLIYG